MGGAGRDGGGGGSGRGGSGRGAGVGDGRVGRAAVLDVISLEAWRSGRYEV